MNANVKPLSSPENVPLPTIDLLLAAIGAPVRWAILTELASGEPRMVKEIAHKLGRSPTLVSKHMALLRRAGVVKVERGRATYTPKAVIDRIPAGKADRARFFKKLADQAPDWLKETWAASKRRGTDKLTMAQIDAEVAAVRRRSGKRGRPSR